MSAHFEIETRTMQLAVSMFHLRRGRIIALAFKLALAFVSVFVLLRFLLHDRHQCGCGSIFARDMDMTVKDIKILQYFLYAR
jgi:hypothetical protein